MAIRFCVRLHLDALAGPRQPWHTDDKLIVSADDIKVGLATKAKDAQLIAGMMTGIFHVNGTFHRLARLLVEAGQHGWDSNSGKRLQAIISRLMKMETEGNLPRLE